jgi:polyhydroxyalkanoate synthesis regulator phasin
MIKLSAINDKMDQYQHETMMWARSLDFFKQENAFLKNRLSEVVDKTSDKYFLAQAEHFQNQFIIKDEFIDELKHDVQEQLKLLNEKAKRNLFNSENLEDKYSDRQVNLREQMIYLEKDFTTLRNEFQDYLNKRPWA